MSDAPNTIPISQIKVGKRHRRVPGGGLAEIFLSNTKQSDVSARDAGVGASLALQFSCPVEVLRRALLRDPHGKASSPRGCALDLIVEREGEQ
jgi:hypothetical protein